MEIRKIIVNDKSIRVYTSEHSQYSHLFKLKSSVDKENLITSLLKIDNKIKVY